MLAQQHKKENVTATKQMFQLICYNTLAPNLCSIRKKIQDPDLAQHRSRRISNRQISKHLASSIGLQNQLFRNHMKHTLPRTPAVAEALTVVNFSCLISRARPRADGNIPHFTQRADRHELCNHNVSVRKISPVEYRLSR